MNTIQTVNFHGQSLLTIQHNGKPYVGMKAVCENIGLGWRGQNERIQRHAVLKEGMRVIRTPSNGGEQSMLCLPLDMLNGWLFGVDVSRIKREEVRERLLQYQRECFGVLYDYWHKGEAKNPRTTTDDRTGLRQAVTMLTGKRGLMHDEAYRLVHQRFNVGSIDELTHEQLPEAVEYVHRLALSGELLPRENKDDERAEYVRGQRVCAVALMTTGYLRWREQEAALTRLQDDALKAMDLLEGVLRRSHAILGSGGAVYDGLYEAQGRLSFPREVLDEGRDLAEKRYKPRILA